MLHRIVAVLIAVFTTSTRGSVSRRCILTRGAAFAIGCSPLVPQSARAAQRGAEPAYKTQAFSDEVCVRRTPLGACAETAPEKNTGAERYKVLQIEPEPESDLVRQLLKKSEENAEANAELVKQKTIKAAQPGTFGPFAKDAPIMRQDGSFDVVPLAKYDRLKDKGKLTKTQAGLDVYIKGFDPDAPEPKQKLFGLF